jgi:6-phosphogluconolactonase
MELVHGPIAELKTLLTQSFEQWASENTEKNGGHGGRASCALSGGATALIFLPALLAARVNWPKITVFWADERAVPPDDPESNYGLAERMLLTPLGRKGPRTMRMSFEFPSLWEAASNYDAVLARELNGRPLDLAILGIGDDGHVASLFPGHEAVREDNSRVVAVEDAPKNPKRRLSLTMRYLLQTSDIWIVAVGARKLPVLQTALSKTQRVTPLDVLLQQQSKRVTVFTDQVIRQNRTPLVR